MFKKAQRPIIETIINSTALFMTSFGAIKIQGGNSFEGIILVLIGVGLEFCKYTGRKKKLWK